MKKSTDNLWNDMLKTDNVKDFFKENSEDIIFNGLEELFEHHVKSKKLKKKDVYENSLINREFGYQIISGRRGATRDKIIQLCFGLKLDLPETQQFLKTSGNRELYLRDPRDAVVVFAIKDGKSLVEANLELEKQGFKIFE